jgi:hypothetical protein
MAKKGSTPTAKPVDKRSKPAKAEDADEGQSKVIFYLWLVWSEI